MNFTKLSTAELQHVIVGVMKTENLLQAKILAIMCEAERRKVYSALQCESLYHFLTEKLQIEKEYAYGLSRAVRVARDLPETIDKVAAGVMSLGDLKKFERFWKKNRIECVEKKSVMIRDFENLNSCERLSYFTSLHEHAGPPMDLIKLYNSDYKRLYLSLTHQTVDKIHKVKNLIYPKGAGNFESMLSFMADTTLEKVDRLERKDKSYKEGTYSRHIPEALKNAVWKRAQGKCENCSGEFSLEVDHAIPFARGGTNDLWNLRLLCRNCNQRASFEVFGT